MPPTRDPRERGAGDAPCHGLATQRAGPAQHANENDGDGT